MSLKKLEFVLENIDPLLFAERGADNILVTTKRYIPGSAIRGALAHLYINAHKLQNAYEDATFFDLFLSGKVRFLPAYPIGCRELEQGDAFVMPLSLMRSKDKTQTVDLTAAAENKAGFKKLQGFVVKKDSKLYQIDIDAKIELHMSRSGDGERIIGSSREGNVFNYEYLEAGQLFKGAYIADDDVAELLQKVLLELNVEVLHLGRAKSAQYGKCLYAAMPVKEAQQVALGDKLYLLAQTPYIAFGSWQRVEQAAGELLGELEARLGCELAKDGLQIFAAAESIDGYVGVWQAKKQAERALSAGTLIELRLNGAVDSAQLQEALLQGLGKGTEDGFGQFIIWQPLARPELVDKLPQKQFKNIVLSNEVKKIAKKIIRERLLQEVRQQAAQDAQSGKLKINIENSNHILKRVEGLMYSDQHKIVIQNIIKGDEFKKKAKDNLWNIKYDGVELFKLLTDESVKPPYNGIDWPGKLNLADSSKSKLQSLLESNAFELDADEVYREYWLWFMRHAVKLSKKEGEQ